MKRLALAAFGALLWFATSAYAETPRNFIIHDTPKPVPAIQFADAEGRARTLADFRGKVVLLNLWATWCVPCRKEMPTLDRLQAVLGGVDFEVVPLSVDRKGLDAVKRFYAEVGIQHLSLFIDVTRTASQEFAVFGLPATLLIGRQGQELGRLIGPAEWDGPEMVAFLKTVIAGQVGTSSSIQQKENNP
jgi:thiol-disulfide isomerase/thioredoxin